jgi:CheY-like chemotaxis protein
MARTVLVVDDDPAFRALARRLLTDWGHDVVGEAGTVAEALAQAVQVRPDAALVDIGLPDGSGFALSRRLRALPRPVDVVLISAAAEHAFRSAARRAGAAGFLPKAELTKDTLDELLGGR